MSEKKRKIFTEEQKAKVALEAVKGMKTINEIAQEHGVHPNQVSQWKKELLENAGSLFEDYCPDFGGHYSVLRNALRYRHYHIYLHIAPSRPRRI
jgi:transposase-like protein